MVADAKNGALHIMDEYISFKGPVGRTFEFPLCITGHPEVVPHHLSIPVGQFQEDIWWRDTTDGKPQVRSICTGSPSSDPALSHHQMTSPTYAKTHKQQRIRFTLRRVIVFLSVC